MQISKNYIFIYLTAMLVVSNLCLNAQVSVRDYGAIGNGIADDTKAIEKAIEAINKSTISTTQLPNGLKMSSYIGSTKDLIFPQGIYLISRPIKMGSYVNITGENAIITGSNQFLSSSSNIGIDATGWQAQIKGLQFVGFKTAIRINNNNVDMGKVKIDNCNFYDNNTAIELNAKSSISIIENCRFLNNSKSLNVVNGDRVIFTKNWITSGTLKGNQDANIINRGILSFTENLLVPVPPQKGAVEPAWINNYGSLSAEGVRQGGEPGSFTLVNNFASFGKDYPLIPNFVVIKNSDCYAVYRNGNNMEPAVIRLFELPNQIVLEDIRGMVDAKLISNSYNKISNPSNWAKQYANRSSIIKIRMTNTIGGNEQNSADLIPPYLKAFAESDSYQLARSKNSVQQEVSGQKSQQRKGANNSYDYNFMLNDLSANYLLAYSGNPNVNGSGAYNGGLVLSMKCNGMYKDGKVSYHISAVPLYTNMGEEYGKDRPYKYTLVWQSTGTPYKLINDTNNAVTLTIDNSTGAERVNLINLNTIN